MKMNYAQQVGRAGMALALVTTFLWPWAVRAEDDTVTPISGVTSNHGGALFYVGQTGTNNSLLINSGGVLTNVMTGYIGGTNGADGNRAIVTDPGSVWFNTGHLFVGALGATGNSLSILNSGLVRSVNGYVGYDTAHSNSAIINNALWINEDKVYVGYAANTNTLTITNGGVVRSVNGYIGFSAGAIADDNQAVVTGTGSRWLNSQDLHVGSGDAWNNSLTISAGGLVSSVNGWVGFDVGSYNKAVVTGPNSKWVMLDTLTVGETGTNNTLTITNGGMVEAANVLIGSAPAAGNRITVTDGNLIVTNPAGGRVVVRHGALVLDSGTLSLNRLLVETDGSYNDTNLGLLTLVNPTPTIEIANGTTIIHSTIAGSQGLGKTGAGELLLTAANSYTGPTFLHGGTMTVQNSAGVGSGGLNVLTGTLRTGSANSGLPVALAISGSYTQAVTGVLEVGLGGATPGAYDQLLVDATASLDGSLRIVPFNSYEPTIGDTQTIVQASLVAGEFSALDNQVWQLLRPVLLYDDPQAVNLVWFPLSLLPFTETPNQRAVATAIDGAVADPQLADLVNALFLLPPNAVPAALEQIAPEELTALFQTGLAGMDTHGSRLRHRFRDLQAGQRGLDASRLALYELSSYSPAPVAATHADPLFTVTEATAENPWGFFIEGVGESIRVDSDSNARGYHLRSYGFSLGLDRRCADSFVLGLTAGYGEHTANLTGAGRTDVGTSHAGGYGGWFGENLYLAGYAGGSYHQFDTKRAAFGGNAEGETDGWAFHALLETGSQWRRGNWTLGLQGTLQYQTLTLAEFTEQGSLAPLLISRQSEAAVHSAIGANVNYRIEAGRVLWVPALDVGWRHQFRDDPLALGARFASGAGTGFVVTGPPTGRDSCELGAGVTTHWSPRWNTYLRYQTELGRSGYQPHTVTAGFACRF